MTIFALTGGIATGKSTLAAMMRKRLPGLAFFDCDESVRALLQDEKVAEEFAARFGREILGKNGRPDRARLRGRVFGQPAERRKLEELLHPKVRKECLEKCAESSKNPATTLFVADVPLLFESGFDFGQELNLVVATSEATQRRRLKARSQLDDRMMSAILEAQLPIMEKVARGDVVFWNEGTLSVLDRQLARFLNSLEIS